jgi:hypothetical protein
MKIKCEAGGGHGAAVDPAHTLNVEERNAR